MKEINEGFGKGNLMLNVSTLRFLLNANLKVKKKYNDLVFSITTECILFLVKQRQIGIYFQNTIANVEDPVL